MENVKMFMFARWIALNYADEHIVVDNNINMSVLNVEDGQWWKEQLEYFNNEIYPKYLEYGWVDETIKFLKSGK